VLIFADQQQLIAARQLAVEYTRERGAGKSAANDRNGS
jgi:hypothetical protein